MATIRVVENLDDFKALEPRWAALVARNSDMRVFQTFAWNLAGWQLLNAHETGARLYTLVATRDGHPEEVIFPFYLDGEGTLRFIAEKAGDTLDAVYAKHSENWHSFYHDVARFINEQPAIRAINLAKVEPNSEILAYFKSYCPNTVIEYHDTCSIFSTEKLADVSSGFPQLNSKERSYLRSLQRKYSEFEFRVYSKANGDGYPKQKIKQLRDWMVTNGMRVIAACPDVFIDLMERMYESGLCEVAVYEKDGEFVEASYRLIVGAHVNFWMVFYKDPQMTTAADVRYVLGKMPEGDWDFDFGTGAYSYKLGTFRPRVFHVYRLRTSRLTLRNLIVEIKQSLRRYVKDKLVARGLIRRRR